MCSYDTILKSEGSVHMILKSEECSWSEGSVHMIPKSEGVCSYDTKE